jgi:plastocyanin
LGVRRRAALALVASAILASLAIGGPASAVHGGPGGHQIKIRDFDYYPSILKVHGGDAIDVWNHDGEALGIPHSVTSIKGYFDTGVFTDGTVTIHAPANKGLYKYRCTEHPQMVGYLRVVGVHS